MRRGWLAVAVGVLVPILLGLATNLVTTDVPTSWHRWLWLAWPALILLTLAAIALGLRQAKHERVDAVGAPPPSWYTTVPPGGIPPVPYSYPSPPAGSPQTYSAAMWAHLALLVAAVVTAIIIPLSVVVVPLLWLPIVLIRRSRSNRGDALVRNHTAQSLNSILTGYLALVLAIGVTVPTIIMLHMYDSRANLLRGVAIGATIAVWACVVVHNIGAVVFAIIGATRARAGLLVRFPIWVAFRLVPDSPPLPW